MSAEDAEVLRGRMRELELDREHQTERVRDLERERDEAQAAALQSDRRMLEYSHQVTMRDTTIDDLEAKLKEALAEIDRIDDCLTPALGVKVTTVNEVETQILVLRGRKASLESEVGRLSRALEAADRRLEHATRKVAFPGAPEGVYVLPLPVHDRLRELEDEVSRLTEALEKKS